MFLISEFATAENFMEFEGVECGSVFTRRLRDRRSDWRNISGVFMEFIE